MNFAINLNQFLVPSDLVTKYMREANSGYLKIYLYILYTIQTGGTIDAKKGAQELDIFESDFAQGIKYWVSRGAFSQTENGFVVNTGAAAEPEKRVPPREEKPPVISPKESAPVISNPKSYDISQITSTMNSNQELSNMIQLAEGILGKSINQDGMKTLYWFYDYLKFPVEVILMLLEYCSGLNKRNLAYIEKVAVTWKEKGIDSVEKADEYMKNAEVNNKRIYELKKILGINDRSLSQSETEYLHAWLNDIGMSEEMVALAFDYCIMSTGKLSFPYMDGIIKNWNSKGIFTIQAAEIERAEHKQQQESAKAQKNQQRAERSNQPDPRLNRTGDLYTDDYDHKAIEKALWDNYE